MKEVDQLYKIRHSLAHIMAQAVLEHYPKAKMGFGPPVDNGFYYDFDFGTEKISSEDFKKIEKSMYKIINQKQEFSIYYKPLDEAIELLAGMDQSYKVEYAKELVETGQAEDQGLSFYVNGSFTDMCEGPHINNTGEIPPKCFKLDRISGSYWRGDEKKPMLTRIYGLAFENEEELKDYIRRRELAMQRDHRKLGAELEIFLIDDEVGTGLPLWLPNGAVIRAELEAWAKDVEFKAGYHHVSTPSLSKSTLYLRSGHLPYYAESMFPPMVLDENTEYYLRPMNCPHHHKIYGFRPRSYRELPYRLAEYGDMFRYEKHGSLSGLLRVRAMCLNDAHIYCEYDQVKEEFAKVMDLYKYYYDYLRLGNFRVRLSLHDSESDKYVKDEEEWQFSEDIVREILNENKIDFIEERGEAAFYGPKVDIQIKNLLGREETVSTCQLDFVMAKRFDLWYSAKDGTMKQPYILHRAPLSTHERMISFLIEFWGGAFPTWMAPNQVMLIPVNEGVVDYAMEMKQKMTELGIRCDIDVSDDSFNKKIRKAVTKKTPNMWIIGENEKAEGTITWRRYCVQDQIKMSADAAIDKIVHLRTNRIMDNFADVQI
ncbi:MAG: threonine--tRNA ligase [Ignavibacteriales bacterium]|jgi:threonyl-tRNA synthetase|nr:threonine--tRNA ligase [Ignavibacteriales bacterium]MBK8662249.1 threonine--tRNA ligase [Ignavibacteriales bacterium]MBP9123500.1 threonine--tRNA ligase [Ignavibacteriaceae bacterium]